MPRMKQDHTRAAVRTATCGTMAAMLSRNLQCSLGPRPSWLSCLFLLYVLCGACTSSKKGASGAVPDPSECGALRVRVESLYREEAEKNGPSEQSQEARARIAEEIADNVDMALVDCRAHPARVRPCLEAAVSAAQLQRDCLIPLDDEGAVEGRMFGHGAFAPK
jgi:hypothetical protein